MSANEKARGDWTRILIDERLRGGLAILWRAYICAQDTGASIWDLSLPISRLHQAGMTNTDLRWMMTRGLVEHREETISDADAKRSFRPGSDSLGKHTRLILTSRGALQAEHVFGETASSPHAALPSFAAASGRLTTLTNPPKLDTKGTTPAVIPRWDAVRRELSVEGLIVKRFRVPARNQETILSVFEEEGWVEHIHDPLPLAVDIDGPTRLHDAINRLNRCQINPVLRFHGDGKGTGVLWGLSQPVILG